MLYHNKYANVPVKIHINRIFINIVTIVQLNTIIVIPLYNLQIKQIETFAKN